MEPKKLEDGSYYKLYEPKRVILDNEGSHYIADVYQLNENEYIAHVTLASASSEPIVTMSGKTEEEAILNGVREFKKNWKFDSLKKKIIKYLEKASEPLTVDQIATDLELPAISVLRVLNHTYRSEIEMVVVEVDGVGVPMYRLPKRN